MKKTTTKTAGFKTFEAAKLAAGKYAGMGINRSEEREHDGKSFTYYHSSAGNVSRDWYALRASDIAAIGYECLGFWDIPAGLKAAALMVCRISDYSRNFRFSLDRLGAWMFHYYNPEGIEYSNGSAEDVKGDRVEMDDDQNARDFVWALSKFERVQIWEKNGKIFMAVGSIDNGTLLLLNAGVNARFVAAEDDVWTVDPVAEIVAAVASYPAEPVAEYEAPKAENCDAEGENAREVAEVRQEAETAPEVKETAKAEAEKIAAMITSSPEGKYNLPDHWRKIWRECGIKGVTVRNNRGGYSYHFTFTFRLLPGDVIPESEALPMLEDKFREDPCFWGEWINDPDIEDECRGNVYYKAFYGWDAEKKERFFKDAARRAYDRMCKNGPGCAVHAWVFYLEREKMRREYPIFTAQFWDRLEVVARSVSCHNYDNSDSQTDYFDVGFYETWDFEPVKEGAKDYTSMNEKLHAVAELFRAKDEAAEKAAEAAREAEHAEYIEKCKKQDQHAREVIDEYLELFPGDAYHPHIIVEWSELSAMNDRGRERGDSTIFSVETFEAITGELDAYFKDDQGYYKLKFEFVDPVHGDHHFVDRCDIGEGTGSYGSRARMVIKWCKEHPNQEYMRDGGATCTPAEGTTDAYYYLENIPATFDEINAA